MSNISSSVDTQLAGFSALDLKGPEPDSKYNDPTADMVFISKQKTLFRFPAYILKRHSKFFQGMLSGTMAATLHARATEDEPIFLDCKDSIVRAFFDFMDIDPPSKPIKAHVALGVLNLCILYECDVVRKAVMEQLRLAVPLEPWNVFCVAAELDSKDLAKDAIRNMGREEYCRPPSGSWDIFGITPRLLKQCEPSYFLGFVKVVTRHRKGSREKGTRFTAVQTYTEYDWELAADDFMPIE